MTWHGVALDPILLTIYHMKYSVPDLETSDYCIIREDES